MPYILHAIAISSKPHVTTLALLTRSKLETHLDCQAPPHCPANLWRCPRLVVVEAVAPSAFLDYSTQLTPRYSPAGSGLSASLRPRAFCPSLVPRGVPPARRALATASTVMS